MCFRNIADDACDQNLRDDDAKWKQEVARKIGCIPPTITQKIIIPPTISAKTITQMQ